VPSFETTARIFQEHFIILRELRNKIELLKQAYFGQMDKKKTWEQVDQIIKVLNTGCMYLDFPKDKNLMEMMVLVEEEKKEKSKELEKINEDDESDGSKIEL
jgi:hypothetical protein